MQEGRGWFLDSTRLDSAKIRWRDELVRCLLHLRKSWTTIQACNLEISREADFLVDALPLGAELRRFGYEFPVPTLP